MSNSGKAVLITGCSTGIGRATAERLAGQGFTVWATARRPDSIAGLGAAGCRLLQLDVTDEDSMRAAVEQAQAEGPLYGLVNNAGYSQSGAVETVTGEELRRQFETNVFGLVRMCQLVLPAMRGAGTGKILNISSMGGRMTFPGGGMYHATKYAVEAISDALRFEVAGFGVRVVLIEPGLITTEFGETAAASIEQQGGADDAGNPYAKFNTAIAGTTAGIYNSPVRLLGAGPRVRRPADRTRAAQTPSACPLHGHAEREAFARRPRGHTGPRMGRRARPGDAAARPRAVDDGLRPGGVGYERGDLVGLVARE